MKSSVEIDYDEKLLSSSLLLRLKDVYAWPDDVFHPFHFQVDFLLVSSIQALFNSYECTHSDSCNFIWALSF